MKIIECIPNFSEGRRLDIVDQIVEAIASTPGVKLLDRESDPSHNRSVITFAGDPESVLEAAVAGVRKAVELIDLNKHEGEHPRVGACDVLPFVPLGDATMEDAIALAKRAGKIIAEELGIPVYFYEYAATRPERQDLAYIRNRQFEGLREAIGKDPDVEPDMGPRELHPTAGAIMIGARDPLVAYNVNLGTSNVKIAKAIARRLRHKTGGFRYVKALGFEVKVEEGGEERKIAQVSMNMTNYKGTPLYMAFENVKMLAERYGVPVIGSEIVGLVPQEALVQVAEHYLRLTGFSQDQILENKLFAGETLEGFISSLAAATPAPGGGAVSALSLAQAFALVAMVAGITLKSKKYKDSWELMREVRQKARERMSLALKYKEEDEAAFNAVMDAYKLPKDAPDRRQKIEEALVKAAEVPLATMKLAMEGVELADAIAEHGTKNAVSDAAVAALQLQAGFLGAKLNVLINAGLMKDRAKALEFYNKAQEMEAEFLPKVQEVYRKVHDELAEGAKKE